MEWYVGDATVNTLSSHVRRALRFQSAVQCPASSLAAPIGADQNPSHMGSNEEAGTAASLDHTIARLQTVEAADQVRNASELLVVVNVRSGVVHRVVGNPPVQRTGRHVAVSTTEVQSHMSVSLTRVSPQWFAEFVYAGSSHARPSLSCAGAYGGSFTGASCTAPVTLLAANKKDGRVVGRQMV